YSRLVGVVSLDNTSDFTLSPADYNLKPGQTQVVTVTFMAKGAAAGHATVSSNDPARAVATVGLTGSVKVAAPSVQVNPASVTISTSQGTPATRTLTVDNTGDAGNTL